MISSVRIACLLLVVHCAGAASHARATQSTHLRTGTATQESFAQEVGESAHREQVRQVASRLGWLQAPTLSQAVERYRQEPAPQQQQVAHVELLASVWFVASNLAVWALIAYLWVSYRSVPEACKNSTPNDYEGDWKHPCYLFFEEPVTCFCGCCCMPLRWAETVSFVKDMLSFWPAFFLFSFAVLLPMVPPLALFGAGFVYVIVGVAYRQELRKRFNIHPGGWSYATDCLLYMCCAQCAIIQEARHVEGALAHGHLATECPEVRQRPERST